VKRYSFCPVCGSRYGDPARIDDSLLLCPSCGFQFWQNSKPTVGALITRVRDGRPHVLLSRRGGPPLAGSWDLPGGFLANGEPPVDGLVRELKEELGVRSVRRVRLMSVDIAEYRSDEGAEEARFVLPMYYRCEIDLDAPIVASDDVAELRWFPLDGLPADMAFAADVRALRDLARQWSAEGAAGSTAD